MNTLTKLYLKIISSDEADYTKKLRKKQAKNLGISAAAKKVAKIEGETDHSNDHSGRTYRYIYRSDNIKIEHHNTCGLSSTTSTRIRYDQEEVYYELNGTVKKFKPCSWIDHVLQTYLDIEKRKEKEEKQRERQKWGMDSECDSKYFNKLK